MMWTAKRSKSGLYFDFRGPSSAKLQPNPTPRPPVFSARPAAHLAPGVKKLMPISTASITISVMPDRSPVLEQRYQNNIGMDSSRIFVQGLPPSLTPDEFVRHFSKNLPITDAKLIPHRRIGYVGYKSPTDAAIAVTYHNKTFIRMSRIGVELACSVRS